MQLPIKEKAEKAYSKFKNGHLPKMSSSVKKAAQAAYDKLHAKGVIRKSEMNELGDNTEEMKDAANKAWNQFHLGVGPGEELGEVKGDDDEYA